MTLKIHVEVYIAVRILTQRQGTFTAEELLNEIVGRFEDTRVGVKTHIAAHCIANLPRSAESVYNFLWRLDRGLLRAFSHEVDIPHPSRADAPSRLDIGEIPVEYRDLFIGAADPLRVQTLRPPALEELSLFYLIRPVITNEHLQENLHLLSAPAGAPLTLHYDMRWVTPDLHDQIERGRNVCIVFGDPPYQNFVPVRQGRIIHVASDDEQLNITVILGTLIHEAALPSRGWEPDLKTFSERLIGLRRQQFLLVGESQKRIAFLSEEQDDRISWRRVIDALHRAHQNEVNRYASTVFLRPLRLRDTEGREVPLGGALAVGKTYQQTLDCYAPHITSETLSRYSIVLESSTTHIPLPNALSLVADGELTLDIVPIEPGKVSVELWVRPDRTQSTTLRLRYPVVESPTVAAPALEGPTPHLTDWHLRAIFEVIKHPPGPTRHHAELGLIDYVLEPLAHSSHYLQEQRALVLAQLNRWDKAYLQFAALDPDRLSPQAITVWFVSACRGGVEDADLGEILSHFNSWDQSDLVRQLITALPQVDEDRRLRLLQEAWLGKGRYAEMWETVKNTFIKSENVLRVARLMVDSERYNLLSPAEGFYYLCEQAPTLEQLPIILLQQAVDWGLQEMEHTPDVGRAVQELVRRLLQQSAEPLEAWVLVNRARDLPPQMWVSIARAMVELLARRSEAGWRAEACKLSVELARTYRERLQDLNTAEMCLTQAHLLVGEDADLAALVDAENARWATAAQRIEAVRMWWGDFQQSRIRRLHERLHRDEPPPDDAGESEK